MSKVLEILKDHYDEYPSQMCLEAITELEAQKAKSCNGCYWSNDNYNDSICNHCLRNDEMRDMYESKA